MEVLKRQIGTQLKIAALALFVVSVLLSACSPSPVPQAQYPVEPSQPQVEALKAAAPEVDQESLPSGEAALPPDVDLSQRGAVPADAVQQKALPAGGAGPETQADVAAAAAAEPAAQVEQFPQPVGAAESAPSAEVSAPTVESGTEPTVGSLAPEFSLPTLDGQTVQMAALRGKNVLINYWVTWCIPCMEELPALNRIFHEYQSENLVILSVNGINQDEMDKVRAVAAEKTPSLPVVLDENDSLYNTYWVRFMPTSFFIDENGVIRHIQLGSLSEEDWRAKIQQLITDQL